MARTNFQYEKRQRELEKKRKAEEKAKRKAETKQDNKGEGAEADNAAPEAEGGEGTQQEHDAA